MKKHTQFQSSDCFNRPGPGMVDERILLISSLTCLIVPIILVDPVVVQGLLISLGWIAKLMENRKRSESSV
jgi:hypothetical protein